MAARVRTLADAVAELTEEVRRARARLETMDLARLDGRARQAAQKLAASVDAFTRELAVSNQRLGQLARTPLLGMLGGGADAEINRLVSKVEALRQELGGALGLVPR